MSKRLEAATNIVIVTAGVLVIAFLLQDRLQRHESSIPIQNETARPQAPPSDIDAATTPIAPAVDDPLDPGPPIETAEAKALDERDVAATVDGRVVALDALKRILATREIAIEAQQYSLRRAALERAVDRVLLDQEARRRAITPGELLRREVEGAVAEPSPRELKDLVRSRGSSLGDVPEAEALAKLGAEVRQARLNERRRRFMEQLRKSSRISIRLQPPRVSVSTADAPAKGSNQAAITIVEFSDFQCPFCKKSQALLQRLQKDNNGKVRVLFKHFPLPGHRNAPKAAEAAECAGEQGRFWEMHDKLFASSSLTDDDLKRFASELGIGGERFAKCLSTGKYAWKWQRDRTDGQTVGVTGTPTFFVNGRPMVGAPPAAFTSLIQEELKSSDSGARLN